MKILSPKGLDPVSELKEIADNLKNKGEIKCWTRIRSKDAPGAGFAKLSLSERFFNLFNANKESAKAIREEAFTAVSAIINKSNTIENSEQLLLNIRSKMDQTGKLRGKDVAAEIDHFLKKTGKDVLQGANVAAPNKASVNLMHVSPLRVKADFAILRSTTLAQAALNNKDLADMGAQISKKTAEIKTKRKYEQPEGTAGETFVISNASLATPKTCVMADLQGPEVGNYLKFITEADIKTLYDQVLKGLTGTVVLEPFPDQIKGNSLQKQVNFTHSDPHLQKMLLAVREAVQNAKNSGKVLHVTIATDNADLAGRIKSLDDPSKLKAANANIRSNDNDIDNQ
jgi:hypothetical protein